jgi:hypothetical protein
MQLLTLFSGSLCSFSIVLCLQQRMDGFVIGIRYRVGHLVCVLIILENPFVFGRVNQRALPAILQQYAT